MRAGICIPTGCEKLSRALRHNIMGIGVFGCLSLVGGGSATGWWDFVRGLGVKVGGLGISARTNPRESTELCFSYLLRQTFKGPSAKALG